MTHPEYSGRVEIARRPQTSEDDLDELLSIECRSMKRYKKIRGLEFETDGNPSTKKDGYTETIDEYNRGRRLFIAYGCEIGNENTKIGYLKAYPVGGWFYICDLQVDTQSERRGAGTKLLECAYEEAEKLGLRGVCLITWNELSSNRPWYERRGFKIADPNIVHRQLAEALENEVSNADYHDATAAGWSRCFMTRENKVWHELYSIRPGERTESDHETLVRIQQAAGRVFEKIQGLEYLANKDEVPPTSQKLYFKFVDVKTRRVFFAVEKQSGKEIGYMTSIVMDEYVHMEDISVDPDFQRRGAGSMLLNKLSGVAEKMNAKGVSLTTWEGLPSNAPWYKRRGFEMTKPEEMGPNHVYEIGKENDTIPEKVKEKHSRCLMVRYSEKYDDKAAQI